MKYVTLNNEVKMPILGFGVYQITDAAQCEKAVLDAVCVGYRMIDTAMSYHNEEAVGLAVEKCGVPRKDMFITTKLWLADAGYDKTMKAFETSLNKLKLEYLDLYLIHQPVGDYYGSWRAMEELYKQGVVRAIGVSNFMPDRFVDLVLNNEILPVINQVEVNPFCQRVFDQQTMEKKNVQIQSWASFAEGRNGLFENVTLKLIGDKHSKSVAQVVLRWLIQRGVVCIPKSVHKERMKENYNVFDFELHEDDMQAIASLDTGKSCFFSHNDPQIIEMLCGLKR
jgi:diketogulonate reductase-like aldo/keto reductase